MEEMTIFTLQDKLRKLSFVSVPQLQMDFEFTYKEAKAFLQELHNRGWVEKEPQGNRYCVRTEQLRLRCIDRSEVDGLIEDIDSDCIALLLELQKHRGRGVEMEDLMDVLDDEDDVTRALYMLTKNRLVYISNSAYCLCISPKTVKALSEMVRAKRQAELAKRITGKNAERVNLRKFFDGLF